MPREEDIFDTAIPAATEELSKQEMTAFSRFSDAIKVVCILNTLGFRERTELHEIVMRYSLFEKVAFELSDHLCKVQIMKRNGNPKITYSPGRISKISLTIAFHHGSGGSGFILCA